MIVSYFLNKYTPKIISTDRMSFGKPEHLNSYDAVDIFVSLPLMFPSVTVRRS